MLKASLHVHIEGDADDYISYSGFELLDEAAELGYDVIAFTCHRRVVMTPDFKEHAKQLDILLIPGIEVNLGGHILILNADLTAQELRTLEDLRRYRTLRPEIFTIAAHPFFPRPSICLGEKLRANLDCFDAIEHSWFYSHHIDWNKKATALAQEKNLPHIATADVHMLSQLQNGHVLIDAEKNSESVLEALRDHRFISVAKPQTTLGMWWTFVKMHWQVEIKRHFPWAPPHHVFNLYETLPRTHQNQSERQPQDAGVRRGV